MGLYTNNTLGNLNDIEFPTVEGYVGTIGAGIALVEGYQNDFALFQAGISGDFAEIAAMQEGADLLPLQEASIKGFFDKIIEFFKKLGAKIKAIFTTFAAKLSSYFTKDNKTFVKKYEKVVLGAGRDYSKMKAKYAEPKNKGSYVYPHEYAAITITGDGFDKDFDRDEAIETALRNGISHLGASEISEISEKMHEQMYEDEEVKDDWNMGDMNAIATRLKNGSKTISDIEKKNTSLQNAIKKAIADCNKAQTNFSKKLPSSGDSVELKDGDGVFGSVGISKDGNKYSNTKGSNRVSSGANIENTQKELTRMQSNASAHQSVILAFCSAVMKEAKFGIAQDRRIFAQAASFRNVTKEDADLLAAIGEAVDFETESDFEAMEIVA